MFTFGDIGRLLQEKYKNSYQFSLSFFGIAKTCRNTRSARITSIGGGTGGAEGALAPPLFFRGGPEGALIYAFISTILPLHECIRNL